MSTLFDKIWASHALATNFGGQDLLYIDRHLVHEVSSPQAFSALDQLSRTLRSPGRHLAIQDQNVPTTPNRLVRIDNPESAAQRAPHWHAPNRFGRPPSGHRPCPHVSD